MKHQVDILKWLFMVVIFHADNHILPKQIPKRSEQDGRDLYPHRVCIGICRDEHGPLCWHSSSPGGSGDIDASGDGIERMVSSKLLTNNAAQRTCRLREWRYEFRH